MGNLCNDARIGALSVRVTTADGAVHEGVPDAIPAEREDEAVDDTGWSEPLRVDGEVVRLQDVCEIQIRRP